MNGAFVVNGRQKWSISLIVFTIAFTFIPVFYHSDKRYPESNYKFVESDSFETALLTVIIMCCPMVVDQLLDYMYLPIHENFRQFGDNVRLIYHTILFLVFVPNLIKYMICLDIEKIPLFLSVELSQSYLMQMCVIWLFHIHDESTLKLWMLDALLIILSLCLMSDSIFVISNVYTFSILFRLFAGVVSSCIVYLGVGWIYKHREILKKLYLTRDRFSESNEQIYLLCYCNLLLMFYWLLVGGFFARSYSVFFVNVQIVLVGAMILVPGRIARQNAIQSDVSNIEYLIWSIRTYTYCSI